MAFTELRFTKRNSFIEEKKENKWKLQNWNFGKNFDDSLKSEWFLSTFSLTQKSKVFVSMISNEFKTKTNICHFRNMKPVQERYYTWALLDTWRRHHFEFIINFFRFQNWNTNSIETVGNFVMVCTCFTLVHFFRYTFHSFSLIAFHGKNCL